jgi:hypothetical protein
VTSSSPSQTAPHESAKSVLSRPSGSAPVHWNRTMLSGVLRPSTTRSPGGSSRFAMAETFQGAIAMATTGLFSGAPAAEPKLVAEAGKLKTPPSDAARW